ncbi:MAG: c-type cytochrome [Zoogloeaceae bacterium]|nr:c-type cytochrome [Zoogloeaceae bacterium]
MRREQMRRILTCMFLAGTFSASLWAGDARLQAIQDDSQALRSAQVEGKKASFFCVNCHGGNGVSKLPEVPNLAGQNADYLLEQTRRFGRGQRKDEFMQGLIKVLSEEEKIQISLFYAGQNPRPGKPDATLVAKGKQIYNQLCLRCHGSTAHGNETIPRLASQHPEYIVLSVTRYRDKTGERQEAQMSAAVAPLKNADITAVAAYLNSLP